MQQKGKGLGAVTRAVVTAATASENSGLSKMDQSHIGPRSWLLMALAVTSVESPRQQRPMYRLGPNMATTTQDFETVQDFAPERTAQALLNLRCAVDHCHDAVFITDSAGKIEFVNAAFEVLTGYSAAEAMDGGLALIMKGGPVTDSG